MKDLRAALVDREGGLAVLTAIALPAVLILGVGAMQIQAVTGFRQRTQEVADSAALWGASQVGVTSNGVLDRTVAWANGQLQDLMPGASVKVAASSPDGQSVRVVVDGHAPSFFVNLFPPGGFYTHAESVAQTVNKAPLCVLVFGTKAASRHTVCARPKKCAAATIVRAASGTRPVQAGTPARALARLKAGRLRACSLRQVVSAGRGEVGTWPERARSGHQPGSGERTFSPHRHLTRAMHYPFALVGAHWSSA